MPFRSRPGQPRDLLAMVENEVRERIEEAVDHVSLELLVARRRALGLPHPQADSARDRAEFHAGARAFLERLEAEIGRDLSADQRARAVEATRRDGADLTAELVAVQVVLARTLPDYWQRFEAVRVAYTAQHLGETRAGAGGEGSVGRDAPGAGDAGAAPPMSSGGQGLGGLLRRLLGG